jgi:hypothetical protein
MHREAKINGLFRFLKNLIFSKLSVFGKNAGFARTDRATDKTADDRDIGTKLLWVEAGVCSLASGFPEHGIPALRRSGDQHLHVERYSYEPKCVWLGIYALESFCGYSLDARSGGDRSLGNSPNIRDWFSGDFGWSALVIFDHFAALALLGGIRSADGDGNQFRNYRSRGHGHHAMVQPVSRKDNGDHLVGIRLRRFFRLADD